jgi:hypothetical protein
MGPSDTGANMHDSKKLVAVGGVISTLLLIVTAGASAISNTGLPLWLAAVFAAYY